jgi:hypothetical protein
MPAKVTTLMSKLDEYTEALLDIHEFECKEFSKDLEKEGQRLLNLTLDKRRPKTGFAKARVKVEKKIVKTKRGCIVEMHFLVADGSSKKPHRIWHIINRGREPFTAKRDHKFRNLKSPRTGPKGGTGRRTLEVRQFGEYDNWVTMRKGRRYGRIKGREFYKETVSRLKKKTLRPRKNGFLEITKLEVNNG